MSCLSKTKLFVFRHCVLLCVFKGDTAYTNNNYTSFLRSSFNHDIFYLYLYAYVNNVKTAMPKTNFLINFCDFCIYLSCYNVGIKLNNVMQGYMAKCDSCEINVHTTNSCYEEIRSFRRL